MARRPLPLPSMDAMLLEVKRTLVPMLPDALIPVVLALERARVLRPAALPLGCVLFLAPVAACDALALLHPFAADPLTAATAPHAYATLAPQSSVHVEHVAGLGTVATVWANGRCLGRWRALGGPAQRKWRTLICYLPCPA